MELQESFEKYIKVMTMTCSQFICLSSQGEEVPISSTLFDSAYKEDEKDIGLFKLLKPSQKMNIETTLVTADNNVISLEVWTIGVSESKHRKPLGYIASDMNDVLKILLKMARNTASFILSSTMKSPPSKSFTIRSQIFIKDSKYEALGEDHVESEVGEVKTPLGTLYVLLNQRTKLPSGTTGDKYFEGDVMLEYLKCLISSDTSVDVKSKTVDVNTENPPEEMET